MRPQKDIKPDTMELKIKIDKTSIEILKAEIIKTVEKAVKDTLEKTQYKKGKDNGELLTRKEVMDMLKVSHATLFNYQKKGIIKYKKIGNRVYFKKEDILSNVFLDGDTDF